MKTALLSILAITGVSALSFGQMVTMEVGASGDISGTQIDYTTAGAEIIVDVHVENISGNSMDLSIRRYRMNAPASWTDYVCWGHETDPFGGTCYPYFATNPWTTPDANDVTVGDGEAGSLAVHINPLDPDNGCPVYRYYVMNGETVLDSLDISVCKSAAIEDIQPSLTVSVAPNPANSYVKVKTSGVEGASVKMVDVLGNVVLKETFIGASKTINVAEFRNGIYFIRVEAKGVKTINRKIIVRH